MARGQHGVRWTVERMELIQLALDGPWLRPGQAAGVLGVHRGTVHNMLVDGRLTGVYRAGGRLRLIPSAEILRLVLEEIQQDEQAGCDMGHCSRAFAEQILRAVETYDERTNFGNRTAHGVRVCDQANDEHDERTNGDLAET